MSALAKCLIPWMEELKNAHTSHIRTPSGVACPIARIKCNGSVIILFLFQVCMNLTDLGVQNSHAAEVYK